MRLLYGTLLACLLSACADRRDPQDLLRRRVALMEAGFRAAHSRAYPKVRALSVPDTDYVKLPVDDLIRRTREHAAKFVSDPARIPDQDLAPHERATFASLYELCLREEILRAGTAFWRAVSLGQPDSCGGTPEGYYEDFAGGALCVVSNGVGFRVHAQAGRAGWKDLYAEAKGEGEGKVVDGRIMGVMRTPGSRGVVSMELAVADGVAQLKLQGYDMKTVVLPGVYVRTASITPEGVRMLGAGEEGRGVHLGAFRGTAEMHAVHRDFLSRGCARFAPPADRLRPEMAAARARELMAR